MPTSRNMRAANLEIWFNNGRRDCRAENAAVSSTEAEDRYQVRLDRGDAASAGYWLGYAEEAAQIESER